ASGMDLHVVACGFDPIDVRGAHEFDAARVLDRDLAGIPAPPVQLLEQFAHAALEITVLAPDERTRLFERLAEPRTVEWLEQIIERVYFERPQGVVIVRRDEDQLRPARRVERFEHLEAVERWHLNVEEEQVGPLALDLKQRFAAVGALAHELDVGMT